jgi:predicted ATPase
MVVSVTGVGGVGKTRLALAAARAAAYRFADGAWLVELATVVAPADVPAAVASQLRLHPESDIDAAAIAAILARQEGLLVLDNCEHVLDAVTELTDALGRHSPRVTVLATTREALDVDGEHVVAVRPLRVDGATRSPMPAGCSASGLRACWGRSTRAQPISPWSTTSAGGSTGCHWPSVSRKPHASK